MLQALHDHKADAIVMESNWVGYYSNKDVSGHALGLV